MQKWIKQSQAFMTLDVVKYCDHVCNVLLTAYTFYVTLYCVFYIVMAYSSSYDA